MHEPPAGSVVAWQFCEALNSAVGGAPPKMLIGPNGSPPVFVSVTEACRGTADVDLPEVDRRRADRHVRVDCVHRTRHDDDRRRNNNANYGSDPKPCNPRPCA